MSTTRKRKRSTSEGSTSEDGNLSPFFHDEDFIYLDTNYPEIMDDPKCSSQETDSKTAIGMQTASSPVETSQLTITSTGSWRHGQSTAQLCVSDYLSIMPPRSAAGIKAAIGRESAKNIMQAAARTMEHGPRINPPNTSRNNQEAHKELQAERKRATMTKASKQRTKASRQNHEAEEEESITRTEEEPSTTYPTTEGNTLCIPTYSTTQVINLNLSKKNSIVQYYV